MVKGEFIFKYPDDDGKASRPWIVGDRKRERNGCDRVLTVLGERPWVIGKISETVKNCDDDKFGIDMFVPIDNRLLEYLDIKKMEKGVPFQIKSSYKACKEFVHSHDIHKSDSYVFADGIYFFVINGLDAKEMIVANLIGQIVKLNSRKGVSEDKTLFYLGNELNDAKAVEMYLDHYLVLKEKVWYL